MRNPSPACREMPAAAAAQRVLTCRGDFAALQRGSPVRINGRDAWFDGFTRGAGVAGAIWVYARAPLPDGSPGVLDGNDACPAWHQVDFTRARVEAPA
jgi:hypothetical protein